MLTLATFQVFKNHLWLQLDIKDFCDYFWKQKDRNGLRLQGKSKKLLNYKSLKSMKQNSPQPNQENAKSAVLFKVERIDFF